MKRKLPTIAIHVGFSLAFLALPYVFAPQGFPTLSRVGANPHERTALLSYVGMLGFFYLNHYALIPKLFFRKKYVLFVASVAACFGLIVFSLVRLDRREFFRPPALELRQSGPPPGGLDRPAPPQVGGREKPPFGFELSHTLFLFLVGLFVSLSLRINQRFRQAEREKLATELAYLKAQINPHFLFNTLNTLYALAIEKSDRTAEAIVRLSALMRYVIRDAASDRVPLGKELEYIGNYVALQKLRLDDTVEVRFTTEGRPNGYPIAPLILISFVENAFKYGVNPQERSVVRIGIFLQENTLRLHVFNRKVRNSPDDESAGGLGLENTRARLQLLYPDRHQLRIQDEAGSFTVELLLRLD